jgi:glutamine cyclotransferase
MGVRGAALLAAAVFAIAAPSAVAAPTLSWTLVATHPHDADAFTQGLVAHGPVLLESTGLFGESTVRRVAPATGAVLLQQALAPELFAEGLTVFKGSALQLTWMNGRVLSYSPTTLVRTSSRRYPFEGWGLTTNGRQLIVSDGTSMVRWLDPRTLRVERSVTVRDGRREIDRLNEIALIDPADGHVRAWLDMARLRAQLSAPGEVLNGIARYPGTAHIAVTGKWWPELFEIRLAGRVPA